MSLSAVERLPPEICLQICELLRDTHTPSIYSFSQTSSTIRKTANMVIFQKVMLPIHNHDSVEKDVQSLLDTLGPITALDHIRKLRLCHAWNYPGADQKARRGSASWPRSDMAPAEVVWTYDHAWTSMSNMLRRCPALSDLLWEIRHQIPPCVLDTIHRYHPGSRLHMRAFCARSLLESEIDKHELAIVTSPCLHSIWFTYMEPDEEAYASRSQRVVQQVLARLAPKVEEVRFRRTMMPHRGSLPHPETELPMERGAINPSTSLRRLEINAMASLDREELKSWHTHVDFSRLHTLVLNTLIGLDALVWLIDCDFASLKVLKLQWNDRNSHESSQKKSTATLFIVDLLPLSELAIGWRFRDMNPIYQRHGASLRTLRLPNRSARETRDAVFVLQDIRDQCPLLAELEFTFPRDQGSITEVAVYKTFATFPALQRLILGLRFKNYIMEDGRLAHYDEFDRRRFSQDMIHGPRYGDVRRALIDRAIDEHFARTVYRLASRANCFLSQLDLRIDSSIIGYPYVFRNIRTPESQLSVVFEYICRSWTVEPGVRDDYPNEVVTREVDTSWEDEPAPEELGPRTKKVFRRIWPGNEDGSSDWRTDWHSFLEYDDGTDEPESPHVSQA
ncbi:uncharacterized protein M437DRAFT_67420 [Aureobasidium melanogenum CBS 110374]|uniref:F-box domain-containing protein n=1 Tax=Aureobasidium melanogenum (strain CBS 110374) TaxID=1043003 RepID=A0A074VLR1_AURM1|nr:uncharacterized protein M437DRAFT_67420 [Aureobasidium melanogenum CBS 110374]KEQ61483.1 hypothetical protein M437DRAFT_67420 [Aureobasidium melanogenum CBS 110374]